jgi:ADP-ribose pyrophosphatase
MKKTLYKTKFLSLISEKGWVWAERTGRDYIDHRLDVSAILAYTEDDKVLLVEQYRIPVGANVIELPAGLIDPGERASQAAMRELLEETGYTAEWNSRFPQLLAKVPSSAGLTSECTYVYIMPKVSKKRGWKPNPKEPLKVHKVDIYGLAKWIAKKKNEGCYIDPRVYVAVATGWNGFTPR